MFYVRADMAAISVALDGVLQGGEWATYEGGALVADSQKTRPGGMQRQVAIGGPTARDDATITIQMTDQMMAPAKSFENRSGRGRIDITVNYLDMDGHTHPDRAFSRGGIVQSVEIPNVDVNSGEVGFLTVIASLDEL